MIQHIIDKPWIFLALLLVLIVLNICGVIRARRENRLNKCHHPNHGATARPRLSIISPKLTGQMLKTQLDDDQEINNRLQYDRRRIQPEFIETLKAARSDSSLIFKNSQKDAKRS